AMLELPADRARPGTQSYDGESQPFALDDDLSLDLRQMCHEEGVTPFMMLMASFKWLLMRLSGQTDIIVGTPVAGRTRNEVEGLIGCFVNTLALRTTLDENESFPRALAREREVCLGAYSNQEIPFEKIVEDVHPDRSLSHNPIFQVMLAMQ